LVVTTLDASLLRQAAQAAAGGQQYPEAALYVVATPIGNLADLSLRAIHVLGRVDAIACEDTRHSAGLLRHLGLTVPLLAVHAHNEEEAAQGVIGRLAAGERVACVSDAGTPAVSDPGARLVARVREAGFRVLPIPGASAATAAVSVAGLGADAPASDHAAGRWTFIGFLPPRGGERRAVLDEALALPGACVFYEAPHRLVHLLADLAEAAPTRRLTLGRELTKQFESVQTLAAGEAPAWLAGDPNAGRGEFVLVLHAAARASETAATGGLDAVAARTLATLLTSLPLKQAVTLTTELTGAARNAVYAAALALQADPAERPAPLSPPAPRGRR
jgi:16S rRNA (cytidine1402-2'-O)-methyltransferase